MKIMKHAEKKAPGAGVLHPFMFAEYPQGCCSIIAEKQKSLLKPSFCLFTTLTIITPSASTAPPSLGARATLQASTVCPPRKGQSTGEVSFGLILKEES